MWNADGECKEMGNDNDIIFNFSDIGKSLSSWDLVRNRMPKIVRQNAFNYDEEVTGIDNIYRSFDNVCNILNSVNLNSVNLNSVNLNDNVTLDIKPVVSVRIDILSEKKVKLIFVLN